MNIFRAVLTHPCLVLGRDLDCISVLSYIIIPPLD